MVHGWEGQTVGAYRIRESIGRGGMSEVYLADAIGSNKPVAIKLFSISDNALDCYRRFQQEMRISYQLRHRSIMPALDYGRDDNVLFLVMPYAENGSLNNVLKCGHLLTASQALDMLTDIGEALDFAHQAGVIHRDVKPHNILMLDDQRFVLSDFGLIRLMDATTQLTMTGKIMGTPAYMSPEQAEGSQIDGRSDIYSLGIVLYECLLGRLPFNLENPSHAVGLHLNALPLRPRSINRNFPAGLEKVLLKTLNKNPAQRYQSAADLATAFERAVNRMPEASRRATLVTPGQIIVSQKLQHSLVSQRRQIGQNSLLILAWVLAGALILSIGLYFFIQNSLAQMLDATSLNEKPNSAGQVENELPAALPTFIPTDSLSSGDEPVHNAPGQDSGATRGVEPTSSPNAALTTPPNHDDPLPETDITGGSSNDNGGADMPAGDSDSGENGNGNSNANGNGNGNANGNTNGNGNGNGNDGGNKGGSEKDKNK